MNIAIVGCGLIGGKRLKALPKAHAVVAVADAVPERAEQLARQRPPAVAVERWEEVVRRPDVDAVVVATTNEFLAPITLAAIRAGKHVLVEKPAARIASELEPLVEEARRRKVVVQVGFNHRFHPALQKARALVDSDALGPLMFLRARYGHGGRVGYEKEWRAKPELSGGGELLDQGVHLIDLSRWFLGELSLSAGWVHTYFWDMPVEDNGFLFLRTASDQAAWLHASCSEWKNLFSLELYGRTGKLAIDGLGGSYGVERLAYYRMLPQMGPPETTIWEYPGDDVSWRAEWDAFEQAIRGERMRGASLEDALAALRIVEETYARSRT